MSAAVVVDHRPAYVCPACWSEGLRDSSCNHLVQDRCTTYGQDHHPGRTGRQPMDARCRAGACVVTYRDRRLARAAQLRGQAACNEARSTAALATADGISDMIPMGQPILVGHHSEGRHRRDLARMDSAWQKSLETAGKAQAQTHRAANIEAAAEGAIYDDDPDAVERLAAKLASLEERRERCKAANVAYRKEHAAELKALGPADRADRLPYPAYVLSNLGVVISATRKRIEVLSQPEQARQMVAKWGGDCRVCPERIEPGQPMLWFRRAGEAEHAHHASEVAS